MLTQFFFLLLQAVSSRIQYKADIVFLVDTSNEVKREHFVHLKQLVKALGRYLNIRPNASHAAISLFGDSFNTILRLKDDQSIVNFGNAIDRAVAIGGSRRIDLALLEGARLFVESRSDVPRIAFILTTGGQADVSGNRPLYVGRKYLQDMNARIYVIALGQNSRNDVGHLKQIASTPNDLFLSPLLSDTLSQVSLMTQHAKKTATQGIPLAFLPDSCCSVKID